MYHLQVLTPEEIFFDENVISLIAPGTMGYLGILKDHAPLMTTLQTGVLIITDKNSQKHFYKIFGGFLEINHNKVCLLVDAIQPTPPIDISSGI